MLNYYHKSPQQLGCLDFKLTTTILTHSPLEPRKNRGGGCKMVQNGRKRGGKRVVVGHKRRRRNASGTTGLWWIIGVLRELHGQ